MTDSSESPIIPPDPEQDGMQTVPIPQGHTSRNTVARWGTSSAGTDDTMDIDDVPPKRTHNPNDLLHAVAALLLSAGIILAAVYMRGLTNGVEHDARTAAPALEWLMVVPSSVLQQLTSFIIVIGVLITLLISREWLQSAISVVALFAGYWAIFIFSLLLTRMSIPALSAALAPPNGLTSTVVIPDIYAGLGAFLTVAGPRKIRPSVKWSWNTLYAVAVICIVLSWQSVPGVIVSFSTGRIIGMLLRFGMGTSNTGLWGRQIVLLMKGIGLDLVRLHRRHGCNEETGILQATLDDDLIENSRIYDAMDCDGRTYTISVLDAQPHNAGYLHQLWQGLRFNDVSVRLDKSASDANHHHLAMLLGLKNCGLKTPDSYGVADSEESSVLVFDADNPPRAYDYSTITPDDAAQFMEYLERANAHGYTHRRITPQTLSRLADGSLVISGWQNGDCASSSTNVAVDKVQLLVLMYVLLGREQAIVTAQRVWGTKTLAALAPFVQKVVVPSETRDLPGWNKQVITTMREQLAGLIPPEERQGEEQVTLARFNLKSFLSITLLIVAVAVIFTQLKPNEVIAAVRAANIWWALASLAFSMLAWAGCALTLGSLTDKKHRPGPLALFYSQAASGFTAVSMPAGVGPAFVNLQFLRKNGYKNTAATAIMSATWIVQGSTTVLLLLVIGLFTGRNTFSGMVPGNTLIVVIGAIVLIASVAMAIPPLRRLLIDKYLPIVKSYINQLLDVLSQPIKLTWGVAGALILNIATGLGFWCALMAFGYSSNPVEVIFVFILANTLGSAVPTPGGLGAVEAALTFAFTSIGVPAAVALSATLVYRVAFYWLRIPIGAFAMKRLTKHDLL